VLGVLADPGFLLSAPRSVRTFCIAEAALREAGAARRVCFPPRYGWTHWASG
jgi:hypothetical protein